MLLAITQVKITSMKNNNKKEDIQMKRILAILLILVLVTVFAVACDVGVELPTSEPMTTVDYESEYADEPEETSSPEESTTSEEANSPEESSLPEETATSDESSTPVEASTPDEVSTPTEETVTDNVNESVAIIVNGAVLSGVYAHTATGATSPTHVPLVSVAQALGATEITSAGLETAVEGLNGKITVMVDSREFMVNGGTIITLQSNAIRHNNQVHVPISFFSEVVGGSVSVDSGRVYING